MSLPEALSAKEQPSTVSLSIEAYDGAPVDALDAPRRPRLRIVGLAASDEPLVWLFAGPLDPALEDDLLRAPLLADSRARIVPCEQAQRDGVMELLPLEPLEPGEEHVLAVAAWALPDVEPDARAPQVLEIRTSSGPESGARAIAAWPPDGAVGVGTDVPSVWLAFDGEVRGGDEGVWIEGPDGQAVESEVHVGACDEAQRGFSPNAVACVRLSPTAWLAPLAPHRIVVGRAALDARGGPVGPFTAMFRTAAGPDAVAPLPVVRACAIDEQPFELGCALISDRSIVLRIAASEPFELTLQSDAMTRTALAPAAELELHVDGLEPGEERTFELALRDSTGNVLNHTVVLRTHSDLASLSITEVRADPLGPEPYQELVELWNFGDAPIELQGMTLSDEASDLGTAVMPAARIDPGVRILLVPDAFDITDTHDVPVPPGTPLVRLGRALGSSGLANRGEALFLRDARGLRLSAAPASPSPMPGVCLQRVGEDARDGSPAAFALDPEQRCTPGR